MEDPRESRSSMPLVSRLDHLDFIMKSLEGKRNLSKWSSSCSVKGSEGQSVPLDLAVREACFKGSLMDRLAFLERKLFQLCLEVESSTASSQASGYASSSQGSKSEPSSSILTSNFPNQVHTHVQPNSKPEAKETRIKEDQAKKKSKPKKQKLGKNKPSGDEKTCKSGRKRASPKWPHLKILGC